MCVPILDQGLNGLDSMSAPSDNKIVDKVDLCDTTLYYFFAYDDTLSFEWSMLFESESANGENKCTLDQCL